MHYFAYGSNMNLTDLAEWCRRKGYEPVKPLSHKKVRLSGYKLVFNYYSSSRDGGALNIVEASNDYVCGVLFELTKEDFQKISKKEKGRNGLYEEILVTVESGAKAKTFKVKKGYEQDFVAPTKRYLTIVLEGARHFDLGKECIDKIKLAAKGN